MGVRRRRAYVYQGADLVDLDDDLVDRHALRTSTIRPGLQRELERAREGRMRDIVATIQPEQDVLIRTAPDGVLAVQEGPGTGKTAVGLHRAVLLLRQYRATVGTGGLLVLGPTRVFLDYVSQVLPSLDEHEVRQLTIMGLVDVSVRATENAQVAWLKGDPRMAIVLGQALQTACKPLATDRDFRIGNVRLKLTVAQTADIVRDVTSRRIPHRDGRTAVRRATLRELYAAYTDAVGGLAHAASLDDFERALSGHEGFRQTVDEMWPEFSAASLVRDLLADPARLGTAAAGVLSDEEQQLLARRKARTLRDEHWTEPDLALIDEAEALITGPPRRFGHVVVDEVEDLTPMQLRMVARRASTGSMTLLGDLAQSTGPWSYDGWDDLTQHVPVVGQQLAELRSAYRSTRRILDLAGRLLPRAAPGIRGPEPIRDGKTTPAVERTTQDKLLEHAVRSVKQHVRHWASTAVIAHESVLEPLRAQLLAARIGASWAAEDLQQPVTLLSPAMAKGLEFDAVILIEPADFAPWTPAGTQRSASALDAMAEERERRALRLLYLTMTRATQHLTMIHSRGLPDELGLGDDGQPTVDATASVDAIVEDAGDSPDRHVSDLGELHWLILERQAAPYYSVSCLCRWGARTPEGQLAAIRMAEDHRSSPGQDRALPNPVYLAEQNGGWTARCSSCSWTQSDSDYVRAWRAADSHGRSPHSNVDEQKHHLTAFQVKGRWGAKCACGRVDPVTHKKRNRALRWDQDCRRWPPGPAS